MDFKSIAMVFAGAGAGGVLRYLLNLGLNPFVASLPLGTLVANVLGSGAGGAMLGILGARADLTGTLRPLVVVGFLGGLTTFSTFTLEVLGAIEVQRPLLAAGIAIIHVSASLLAAMAGLAAVRALLA